MKKLKETQIQAKVTLKVTLQKKLNEAPIIF